MKRPFPTAVIAVMSLLLLANAGCASLREMARENERKVAISNVRMWHKHRHWQDCVASADRAQAASELDPSVAAEITLLKAKCLRRLDRVEESLAHFRMLRDFMLTPEQMPAIPTVIRKRLLAEPTLEAVEASPHNQSLISVDLSDARFTRSAKWSGLSGGVLIQWRITKGGVSEEIRILNDVHPLLAGLAIEAAAASTVKKAHFDRLPLTKRVQFRFGEE